ncbi:MAG TPA: CHAD domain-containing protein [Rhizomicrobium sp.]|jgi:CHAD domain-containing protein|nr:CHAD domain-containing protein [Rhizomicrobium sp.]
MSEDARMEEPPRVAIVRTYRPSPGAVAARAVNARRVHLYTDMTAEEAFRTTVLECLAQVGGNAPAIRARDPEGVHQLRVGLRRLQMALKSFGAQTEALKALGKRGRAIADAFGPARELDVFADEILKPVARKYADNESFAALTLALRHARGEAWDDALAEVLNPDFGVFLNDVAAAAEQAPRPGKIGKTARQALDADWEKVKTRGKKIGKRYDERVHRLRIALKKLRYAAEFFAPLYPAKKTRAYIKALKRLLDRMGEANDIHGIGETLARIGTGPELRYAAGVVAGWHASREKALTLDAMDGWKRFKTLKPFWR